jgi:FMN phosphatase YigB (HAD superfamily)
MDEEPVTKAVVFDVGGVLIELHSEGAKRELTEKCGLSPHTFSRLTRSCFESYPRSITELAMIGEAGTSEYLEAFLTECRVKDLKGLKSNRLSVMGRERTDVVAIVKQLKQAGLICCVLSNTIALHWEKLCSSCDYPSFGLFDRLFPSYLIGCAKPQQASFSFVANALKLRGAECLLTITRSDILIREQDRNVFVGECKVWKGSGSLTSALDQILDRYLHWRDTKAAILVFNRNKNFSDVLAQIQPTVESHSCCKRTVGQTSETEWRFVFGNRDDPNREIHLSVLAFDVPS